RPRALPAARGRHLPRASRAPLHVIARVSVRRQRATRTLLLAGAVVLSVVGWAGSAASQNTTAPSATGVTSPASTASEPDVQSLGERAAAFWAARVAGDFVAQWELLEPRGRGRMTPFEYATPFGAVKYLAYQIEDVTVDGYFASVNVRAITQAVLPTAGRRV